MTFTILPRGHWLRRESSFIITMSSTRRFDFTSFHFSLGCKDFKYSCFHLFQNWSARYWAQRQYRREHRSCWRNTPGGGRSGLVFIVRSEFGLKAFGCSGLVDIMAIGRELTMRVTFAMWVRSNSCVNQWLSRFENIPSNTRHIVPICRSQTPPKWEARGGLNCHSQFW